MKILITGGASGLGAAIIALLVKQKIHQIYFTYFNSITAAKEIELQSHSCHGIKCDFSNSNDIELLQTWIASQPDLDLLINNAYSGKFINTHFHSLAKQEIERDFHNNILPTFCITQSAVKVFRKNRKGQVITILSAAMKQTAPIGSSLYIAGKTYLESMSKAISEENIKFNIRATVLYPGMMPTKFTKDIDERVVENMLITAADNKLISIEEVASEVIKSIAWPNS